MDPTPRSIWFVWLAACLLVLFWWTGMYAFNDQISPPLKSESQIYVLIAMSILSFPAGLIWAVLIAGVSRLLHELGIGVGESTLFSVLIYWIGAVTLGYCQWFVLLPKYKAKRRASSER